MPLPPASQPNTLDAGAIAGRLSGEAITDIQLCGGGGNNRVYRVRTTDATFALKCYGANDDRDRLGHEFEGLTFLKNAGIRDRLPWPIAVDRDARCALYEWIEGQAVTNHGIPEIAAVLDLAAAFHGARDAAGAAALLTATEAVLRISDLLGQLDSRLARLERVTAVEPELAGFLTLELVPEFERCKGRLAAWDLGRPLAAPFRTLSPSDFGFHNALRTADGTLRFIDFEYFGWDDPVKLTADFLWHPAMNLSAAQRAHFLGGAVEMYGGDPLFSQRLAVCFPLYGIRWSLIILNEFLPEIWARRAYAGKGGDWESAKRAQLEKARTNLAAIRSYREGQFQ